MGREQKLDMSNWQSYDLSFLDDRVTEPQRAWNQYVVLKQAEVNTMMQITGVHFDDPGSLCSAYGDGGCDQVNDWLA